MVELHELVGGGLDEEGAHQLQTRGRGVLLSQFIEQERITINAPLNLTAPCIIFSGGFFSL